MDFIYNYEYVEPHEWKPSNIEFICLNIVPRKITSEIEIFENYGDILIQFFMFLGSKSYIINSKELITKVSSIKDSIVDEAKKPTNWGMAKSLMMSEQEEGFDITEDGIENIMLLKQLEAVNQIGKGQTTPLKENPYKDIGRNQKITVKYTDGKISENIKFKKVEKDLKSGLCEIVKK